MSKLTTKLNTGAILPLIGLGTWKAKPLEAGEAVKTALQAGYRHIDCATIYGNEEEIGNLSFGPIFKSNEIKREDVFVTSKLWNTEHAPEDVKPALLKTLRELQLDYLDLYLVHWPVALQKNASGFRDADGNLLESHVPIKDTWQAMEKLLEDGKVKAIGVSNFSIKQLTDLLSYAKVVPAVNQIEVSPYLQQKKLVDFCAEKGIHITAYSSLGSGASPNALEDPVIVSIAKKHNATPAQVVIRWVTQYNCSALPKSANPERIRQNLASQDITLDKEDMNAIEKMDNGYRYNKASIFWRKGQTYEEFWDL